MILRASTGILMNFSVFSISNFVFFARFDIKSSSQSSRILIFEEGNIILGTADSGINSKPTAETISNLIAWRWYKKSENAS